MHRWYFDQARHLLTTSKDSAMAALHLTMGYFETYASYASGQDSRGNPGRFFTAGFLDVFPPRGYRQARGNPDPKIIARFMRSLAAKMYEAGRCGLFHSNLTGAGILLRPMAAPITPSVSETNGKVSAVFLDPEKILERVEDHFTRYVARLRNPVNVELRARFERAWAVKRPKGVILLPGGQLPAELARRTSLPWGADGDAAAADGPGPGAAPPPRS